VDIRELADAWTILGRYDPLWAVLTEEERRGGKWAPEDFFATGVAEVRQLSEVMTGKGLPWGGARALDFGCGVGRITQALAEHFERVDGVDISAPMLEQARRFNARGDACCFTENQRPDLQLFPSGHFDFIYSRIVLQHMPAPLARGYLREFHRVLRPGGVLFFQIPSGWNPSSVETYEELRHYVTVPRKIYKAVRRVVMFDWRRPPVPPKPRPPGKMYFTPVPRVVRLLERLEMEMVAINRDDACGESIRSYNYLAFKPAHPPARVHSRWAWRRITRPR